MRFLRALFTAVVLFATPLVAAAGDLPGSLNPLPPFPSVYEAAPTIETVAPGVEYAEYQLNTAAGPLSIHVVSIEPQRQDVSVGTVLASNALQSKGETVGSMAKRTNAVAGINADYFDIGNTNRPLNIVVRNGVLLQMPRKRYALAIGRDGTPRIAEFTFNGEVLIGSRSVAIDGVDELPPPNGGTSLITPEYGSVSAEENLTLVSLSPLDGTPPLARFRVNAIADNLRTQPPGYYVAIGSSAYNYVDLPSPGDVVTASGDLSPVGLGDIATAVGGGPLILHNGTWYDDADGPRGGEYSKRIPSSGAAITSDGRLLLIEVDGREPANSVGLTRHEFASLMRALGGVEGLAFDGGGSSTFVVRRLGDPATSVANQPSDGKERPVANGVFVYSTAPVGPATRLVARPGIVRAVSGADVELRVAALDAAGHVASATEPLVSSVEPASLGIYRDGHFTALQPGTGRILVRSGRISGQVAVEVTRTPARVAVAPPRPNVERNGSIDLDARAYDAHGYRLTLPALLAWTATTGRIDAHGTFHAGAHNADVSVRVGESTASARVTVGSHDVTLPFAEKAHFVTIPHGGGGSLTRDPSCDSCVALEYSFATNERAAYAMADLPLPAGTVGLEFDVLDDGSDARLRVAIRNTINEEVLTDAALLDQPGWRHVVVRFPADAAEAARLSAIYVLPPKGMQLSNGQIVLRNVRAIVAGENP